MPYFENSPTGICRRIPEAKDEVTFIIDPAPDYGRQDKQLIKDEDHWCISNLIYVYSSHNIHLDKKKLVISIPAGNEGWVFLSNKKIRRPDNKEIEDWYQQTIETWEEIASHVNYNGIYGDEISNSIRAIRLLTDRTNWGIIAAATTSLPEVIGGQRNYDYRYVWLRDAGMIVSALSRSGSDGVEEKKFLDFICDTAHKIDNFYLIPLFSIDQAVVDEEFYLEFEGFKNSKPVRIGNNANKQLQLDALGNVLLAAKLIYQHYNTRSHWDIMSSIGDYLAENWHQEDHGLWEETIKRHYTSSKVIVARGLETIIPYSDDNAQKERWQRAIQEIRDFVKNECLNSKGAYAAYAGGEAVDISAALFPVWAYTEPDTPVMKKTIDILEKDYSKDNLYWRHLEEFDSKDEGAFLAGTFWMAQYWIMMDQLDKAKAIIDAGLLYSNDLGFFAEEARDHEMIGNFPQTFVHASFVGAVVDLNEKMKRSMTDDC